VPSRDVRWTSSVRLWLLLQSGCKTLRAGTALPDLRYVVNDKRRDFTGPFFAEIMIAIGDDPQR